MKRHHHPLDHLYRAGPPPLELSLLTAPARRAAPAPKPSRARRPWIASKAAWAKAEADKLRAVRDVRLAEYVPQADQRNVRRKMVAIDYLRRDIERFDRLAKRFAEEEAIAAGLPASVDEFAAQFVPPF